MATRAARRAARLRGEAVALLLTLLAILVLWAIGHSSWHIQYPGGFLFLIVVAATFVGGLRAGLVSAAMALLYSAYNVADVLYPPRFSADDLARLIPLSITYPAIAWLVGALHSRDRERALALAELNASLEERVSKHAAELALVEERLGGVIAHAPVIVFVLDEHGRFTLSKGAGLEALGVKPGQSVGLNIFDVYAGEPGVLDPVRRALAGETFTETVHMRGRAFQVAYAPQRDARGRITGLLGVSVDVTERVQAEAALQQANEELTRSNRELEQFAYIASHDLQEPLRTIGSFSGLLASRYRGQLDENADKYLTFMEAAVARMKGLIEDLLTYSRLRRDERVLTLVPAGQALQEALSALGDAAARTKAEVTWSTLPDVYANADQLTRVFQNLLGNAIKFRSESTPPRIHVSAAREEACWHFTVSDNGIGIAPEYHERIFLIFQRLHGRGQYEGSGMGLALCKNIIERHGGRLWVESAPGEGSTFHFTLPVSPPTPPVSPPTSPPPLPMSPPSRSARHD